MNLNFTIGDVVTLKSNSSLKMTVNGFTDSKVECLWFGHDRKLYRDLFNPLAIEICTVDEGDAWS